MHLIDAHRLPPGIVLRTATHVIGVAPSVIERSCHHRGRRRPHFAPEAEWIGLQRQPHALPIDDLVLVDGSGGASQG